MKLERARELYSEYAEGTLSPAMRLALEQHFENEPDARSDFAEFQRIYQLIEGHEAPNVEVPLGFRAKVLELAAEAQAKRDATPARRAALTLTGWFGALGTRRRVTGGFAAALCVAVLAGVFFHSVGNTSGTKISSLLPSPSITLPSSSVPTVITGVSTQAGGDSNTYHMFHVHLPSNVPQAVLSAYVVTSTDQIIQPDVRAREATTALAQPQHLTNREEMQIPVALLKEAPAGTTLNVLVQYVPDDPHLATGTQVIFTPVASSKAPEVTPSGDLSFFDALQDVAAAYGVTVISDASSAPTNSVTESFAGSTSAQALQNIAAQVGWSVQKLNDSTYQLYPGS